MDEQDAKGDVMTDAEFDAAIAELHEKEILARNTKCLENRVSVVTETSHRLLIVVMDMDITILTVM